MMKSLHIQLDPLGGAAGDMFIAAVLHAFPELQDGLIETVRRAGLPDTIGLEVENHIDHALTGLRFVVDEPNQSASGHRSHRSFSDIREHLQQVDIDSDVRQHAIGIFTLLAEAEARVHGKSIEDVSFHELGEWDSIADIVGAAFLIASLGADWSVGPLPLGNGRVKTAHGPLPIPAPATTLLLQDFECLDDGIGGERVTPTGAAILRYLEANQPRRTVVRRLRCTGLGFGTRQLPGLSNVLRLLAFDAVRTGEIDLVTEITFEVDDQTPEDLAIGLDRLREHPGVKDVLQMAAVGKKGRLAVQVRVLADPAQRQAVCDACLAQTTTIGLRFQTLERRVLSRRQIEVDTDGHPVRVKAVERGLETTVKAEADDIGRIGADRGGRDRQRRAAERAAVQEGTSRERPE